MQKLIWTNANGDSVDLTSGHYGITNWEGFSNTSLNIQTQQVPFQDGGVFLDALMEQRELTVTLAMNDEGNLETRYRLRRELIHILNPKLGEGYLIYKNDFTQKRIKCVAQIPLFETHNSDTVGTPKASLSWTACNPYWEDLEDSEVVFNILKQPTIVNDGDVPCQMEIEFFTNGVVNPQVTNITQNQVIKYNGTLSKNLDINTNAGKKTVTTEQLNFISNDFLANLVKVATSDSLVVALDENRGIVTSPDGKNWTLRNSGEEIDGYTVYYTDVIFIKSKGLYIVVGYKSDSNSNYTSFIISSPDAINWTEIYTKQDIWFTCIGYSETLSTYMLGNDDSFSAISTDCINWTFSSSGGYTLKKIIYAEQLSCWYGLTSTRLYKSIDGLNWTNVADLGSVAYSEKHNLLIGTNNNTLKTSNDGGNTWSTLGVSLNHNYYQDIYYFDEVDLFLWVGFSYFWQMSQSTMGYRISQNGINWGEENTLTNPVNGSSSSYNIKDFVYYSYLGYIIGVGNDSVIQSVNGLDWSKNNPHLQFEYNWEWDTIIYSDKYSFFIGCIIGRIYTSSDGINWSFVTELDSNVGKDIIYAKNNFILLGTSETNCISPDGINWTTYTLTRINKYGLAYSETEDLLFMSGGEYMGHFAPKILSSPDGINWTTVYIEENTYDLILMGITCSDTTIVAVGGADNSQSVYNALIVTSTDGGVSWTEIPFENKTFKSVAHSKLLNLFVAVGYAGEFDDLYGVIYTSPDGLKWTEIEIETKPLYKIMYSESLNLFVIVGDEGTALTSSDGINWTAHNILNTLSLNKLTTIAYSKKLNQFLLGGDKSWTVKSETESKENKIQNISADSDMNMNLQLGDNKFRLNRDSGDFSCRIKYRQKYIGV